ncbi:MAG TPA: hypothetical protein VLH75_04630 [Longimicrobiales bacterium]|nr:hypothetical protein [Longimicrobiales bacterium]
MTARIDPSLGSVAQQAAPGALGLAEPALARPGVAGVAPFLLEGERLAVTGTERHGDHAFWVGGRLVAEGLATDAGAGVNLVAAPASLRRELLGPRGSLLELTLAVPTLPLAAVQWRTTQNGRWPGALGLRLTLLPRCGEVRYHVRGEGVRCVAAGDGGEMAVELRVHPEPAEWRVAEAAGGGIEVRASISAEGPVTLLLAAGSQAAAAAAMAAAPHLSAHELRAAADADVASRDALTVSTGVPELDHGVSWAAARARGGLLRGASGSAEGVFWAGLGAVGVGDATAGQAAVDALRCHGSGSVPWRLGSPVPADALATLLAARFTLLSGDPDGALEALRLLPPEEVAARRATADPPAWALWALALGSLADALRYAAVEGEIRALREAAALGPPPGRVVRLPMAGHAPTGEGGEALGRLLSLSAPLPAPPEPDTPLGAWALWAAPDPDAAWTAWRSLLGRGPAGGAGGRGTWDVATRPPGAAAEAGILLCGLAHGLLGLAPDAPSGRIRIAPSFPTHVSAFRAGGIGVGEAELELRYEREGRTHRLRLEPTRGRAPVTVVLAPSVSGEAPGVARVDGVPAELDAVAMGTRIRFSVQLVLDAPRTVEVDVEPARAPRE